MNFSKHIRKGDAFILRSCSTLCVGDGSACLLIYNDLRKLKFYLNFFLKKKEKKEFFFFEIIFSITTFVVAKRRI